MDNLIKQLKEFHNRAGHIIFEHIAFDRQIFTCENLCILCTKDRVGISILNKDIYILLKDITSFDYNNNECIISTKIKAIKIKIANF